MEPTMKEPVSRFGLLRKETQVADQYQQCAHVMVSGGRCGSPALLNSNCCYWHHKAQNRYTFREMTAPPFSQRPCTGIVLPVLEDANAIQVGIQEIAHAMI